MTTPISYNSISKTLWLKKHKGGIKKVSAIVGLFLLFFIVAFVVINWSAVKFNVEYKLQKTGQEKGEAQLSTEFVQQLEQPEEKYYEGEDRVIIPKIDIEAPIVYADTFDEGALQEYLRQGLIHYVDTAKPGEKGNMVIVGHSSSYQWDNNSYGRVFALLNELEEGDSVFFIANHKKYHYHITEKFVIKANQVEVLSQEGFEKPTVTLMSCWPIGTYWKRLVVRGELVQY